MEIAEPACNYCHLGAIVRYWLRTNLPESMPASHEQLDGFRGISVWRFLIISWKSS